jgi:type IV fimbrial biogenesis protein FimT
MTLRFQKGFTLIELLSTIVVLVILIVLAGPSLIDTLDRRRIINATQALVGQVQQARSIAIARNDEVSIVFRKASAADWCFGLTDSGDCDCTETDQDEADACTVGVPAPGSTERVLVRAGSDAFSGVELDADSGFPLTVTFEPTRGIRTEPSGADDEVLDIESSRGLQTQIQIGILGRVFICSPSGDSFIGGVKPCN